MIIPKPCPFCGGDVTFTYNSITQTFNVYHLTDECHLSEPIKIDASDEVKSLADAKKVWNERKA